MPITINGSGTIGGLSAGGLPDGSITTADLNSAVPVAKAWVNFNGTGTVAIRANYNVSSITDNATGDYTVNFTTALADANYSVAGSSYFGVDSNPSGDMILSIARRASAFTASSIRVSTSAASSGTPYDQTTASVAVFR